MAPAQFPTVVAPPVYSAANSTGESCWVTSDNGATTSKPAPVLFSAKANAEIEFSTHGKQSDSGTDYFSTDNPVDVDEALQQNAAGGEMSASEPPSQMWTTTEIDQNNDQGWKNEAQNDEDWNNQEQNNEQGWINEEQENDQGWSNEQDNNQVGLDGDQVWNNDDEANNAAPVEEGDNQSNGEASNEWNNNNEEQGFVTTEEAEEPTKDSEWATVNDQPSNITDDSKAEQVGSDAAYISAVGDEASLESESKSQAFQTANSPIKLALNSSNPEDGRKKTSPARRLINTRKFQSLDLNLNVDGAASISSNSDASTGTAQANYWHNYSIMKHKASWLYNNAWSRRTSDASSFVSGAQEIDDLYFDDEIGPNLESDPNMMLTAYYRNTVPFGNEGEVINFPARPCLTDRGYLMI